MRLRQKRSLVLTWTFFGSRNRGQRPLIRNLWGDGFAIPRKHLFDGLKFASKGFIKLPGMRVFFEGPKHHGFAPDCRHGTLKFAKETASNFYPLMIWVNVNCPKFTVGRDKASARVASRNESDNFFIVGCDKADSSGKDMIRNKNVSTPAPPGWSLDIRCRLINK